MSSINKVALLGRIGKKPEIKVLKDDKKLCLFSLATSEKFKDNTGETKETTQWHNLVMFGKQAEIAEKYLDKGSLVYVEGKIQYRQYEDKEGQKRYITEIIVLEFKMIGPKPERTTAANDKPQPAQNGYQNEYMNEPAGSIDDDLPF